MVKVISILATCIVAFPVAFVVASEPGLMEAPGSAAAVLKRELQLRGTMLIGTGDAMAAIQIGKAGEQKLYSRGDVVEGGRLTNILHDRVTLTFADIEIELLLSNGTRGTPAAAVMQRVQPRLNQTETGLWLVERKTLDRLSSATELDKQVKSLGSRGVQVARVQDEDLFHKLGLQQGDIINSINGSVPGADVSLQQAIAQTATGAEATLRLEVERQGLMDILYYEIDP